MSPMSNHTVKPEPETSTWGGQGDLIIVGVNGLTIWVIGVISLLTKST